MAEATVYRRRVLVAFDPCAMDIEDFEASARLAAGLNAELVGLLVENSNLIAAAELPGTRLIAAGCRGLARVDAAAMRRAFRVAEGRAREHLSAAAERWQLQWSFEVTESGRAAQTLSRLGAEDLLALGGTRVRRAVVSRRTAAVRAERAPCPVVLLRPDGRRGQPVAVIYEGNPAALAVARDLARIYEGPMLVLAAGSGADAALERESEAARWLEEQGAAGVAQQVAARDAAGIGRLLREVNAGVVVVDRRAEIGRGLDLDVLAEETPASLVVLGTA